MLVQLGLCDHKERFANDFLFSRVHPEDRERVRAGFKGAAGTDYADEYRVVRDDGAVRWVAVRCRRFPDQRGGNRVFGILSDITDRKLAEEALIRNEKLASVGRMAASIAHEVNNPLEAVMNLLYLSRNDAALSACGYRLRHRPTRCNPRVGVGSLRSARSAETHTSFPSRASLLLRNTPRSPVAVLSPHFL